MRSSRCALPSAGNAASHRQQRGWIAVATILAVLGCLLHSGCSSPKGPERPSVAAAQEQHSGTEGSTDHIDSFSAKMVSGPGRDDGTVSRPQFPPDALFAQASPAVVQVIIEDQRGS